MKIIKFKECNVNFAENQKEYKTLPAFYDSNSGIVVSCYRITFKDLIKVIFTRKIWLGVMTFHKPLQPQLMSVDKSDLIMEIKNR